MPITVTSLTSSANNVDANSFTTASVTPTAGALILVAGTSRQASGVTAPTFSSSHSLATGWTLVSQHSYDTAGSSGQIAVWAAIAGATPGSSAITMDFGGVSQVIAAWSVVEVLGYAGTGLGPGAGNCIVQAVKSTVNPASATSSSVTLAAASATANRPIAFASVQTTTSIDVVPRTNWTELNNSGSTTSGSVAIEAQWRSDQFETTASATWTDSVPAGLIALEIAGQPPPTTVQNTFEGGTPTAAITTGNSGGTSGTAFDFVNVPATGSVTYTGTAYRGSVAGQFATGGTAGIAYAEYTTALNVNSSGQVYCRLRFNLPSLPADSTGIRVAVIGDSTGSFRADLRVTNTGAVSVRGSGGTALATFSATYAAGTWWDVGFAILVYSATVGQIEGKLYDSSGAVAETLSPAANQNTLGAGGLAKLQAGQVRTIANATVLLDDLAWSTTGYPSLPSATTTVNGTAAVAGAGSTTATVVQRAGSSAVGAGGVAATVVQRGQSSVAGAGAVTAAAQGTITGTAAVAGAGAVSAAGSVTVRAAATVAGSGSVAASVVQRGQSSQAGSGSVAAFVVQAAAASVAGAGAVSANVSGSTAGTAALVGVGSVTAAAVQAVRATVAGAGAVAAAVTVRAGSTAAGAGAVTATVVQRGQATVAGTGTVTAGAQGTTTGSATVSGVGAVSAAATVTVRATAAITGAGATTSAGRLAGSATVTGAGAVTAAVVQRATAAATGEGLVVGSVGQTIVASATAAGAGAVIAAGGTRYTSRPSTGATTRAAAGTTPRPFTTTTLRTAAGTTARPLTTTTARP